MANQRVRPIKQREFLNALVTPYPPGTPNPNEVFSQDAKLGQPEANRAYETSQKDVKGKDISIGIKDVDEAVMYYMKNVLKLSVVQNNTRIEVPVMYGTPENWKGVQQDGYYRDKTGKLLAPLIMFKRTSIAQNRNLGYKIDGNVAHNLQLFEKGYTKRNQYSNFSVLTNRIPQKEYAVAITPDYVTIEYSCIVWTYFAEQMDKIVEALNFASRSYWGELERFKFYVSLGSFEDSSTYNVGEDRAVRTTFTMTLNGYLVPDSINAALAANKLQYSAAQVVFDLEVANGGTEQFIAKTNKTQAQVNKATNFVGAGGNVVNSTTNYTGLAQADLAYITTNVTKVANVVTDTTATFNNSSILQPSSGSSLPATSISNFTFYANALPIIANEIVSFLPDAYGNLVLTVDPTKVGYYLTGKTIIAVGKFA